MPAIVIIAIDERRRDLWLRRVGGLTVLGRAILALGAAGLPLAIIGGDGLAHRALAGRQARGPLHEFPAGATREDVTRALGPLPAVSARFIAQPFICDLATVKLLLQSEGEIDLPWPLACEKDADAAASKLLKQTRKTLEADGIVCAMLLRPLSRLLTGALIDSKVTPNQVTAVAMMCGLISGILAAQGGYLFNVVAAFALLASVVADCVDGEIARLRLQGSRFGEWLDSLADDICTLCYLIGLSLGVGWLPFGLAPLPFGLGCAAVFVVMSIYVYDTLVRHVGILDTSKFPYFFMASRTAPTREATFASRAADIVALAFKRDFFIALFVVFAVCGIPWLSLLVLGAGLSVTALAVLLTAIIQPPRRRLEALKVD